ncbi:MAG: hypothetical protein ACXWR1_08610 [Bdellovibrionota bacterium]
MKIFLGLSLFFLSFPALAETPSTGLGVTLGSPNGITARHWLSQENSIDAGAGWDLLDSGKFEMYSDYLWNRPDTFEINGEKFDLFFGGGLALRSHSGNGNELVIGPRLPVGVSYEFTHPDLEVFAALALNVGIIPHSDVFLDAHIGVRFYLF